MNQSDGSGVWISHANDTRLNEKHQNSAGSTSPLTEALKANDHLYELGFHAGRVSDRH